MMDVDPSRQLTRPFDVLVIGAGPAGMAAAVSASASGGGGRVGLVDDNPDVGGQIWRNERTKPTSPEAVEWFGRARVADFETLSGTRVIGLSGANVLTAESKGRLIDLPFRALILATGARELFLPFPGWTLPNVMGAGGLQALVKAGLPIEGKRVVVAGSGPLLLAVAAALKAKGADVRAIVEQAPLGRLLGFAVGLWSEPGKIRQAIELKVKLGLVPYRSGWWPCQAKGAELLESVVLTDGRKTREIACDYLACGFGLVPNLELASILGCGLDPASTQVDPYQRTTIPHIYSAGEATGIGGLEPALLEGQIAGFAATGQLDEARALFAARDRAGRFARNLERAFAPRDELRALATPETIVCRCEDVPAQALAGRTSWVDAKLQTRCGMGPCQGRICGGATEFLYGWTRGTIRPPLFPTKVAHLGQTLAGPSPSTSLDPTCAPDPAFQPG